MSGPAAVDLLDRALRQTGRLIAATGPNQGTLPTPCSAWDVAALVRHVVGNDLRNFAVVAAGGVPQWGAPPDDPGHDWTAAYEAGAEGVRAAWRAAEAPQWSRADQQIAELAAHGWDLARATGQDDLDPALAEHGLAWAKGMLRPEHRGPDKAFAAEVAVPDDAPAYDRLAGWFGRDPSWRAAGR
ncbi:MAG TPA: TIGR03086 family metal-binding protein [Acidimicrobiales bacterium]|nr:TIGR03086 family metal-binding protein [Acidimicrobiales bacterium]